MRICLINVAVFVYANRDIYFVSRFSLIVTC